MSSRGNCIGCGVAFGVFNKEHGCKNCRCTFCSKCLTKKIEIPHLNNSKHEVCQKCYKLLKSGVASTDEGNRPPPPPDTYYKRLSALETADESKKSNVSKKVIRNPDDDLSGRLNKLHVDHKEKHPIPSVSEISARLHKLQGIEEPAAGTSANNIAPTHVLPGTTEHQVLPGAKTEQEQIDNLLASVQNEVNIDKEHSQHFASCSDESGQAMIESPDLLSPDDGEVDNIIEQIMEEARLDESQMGDYSQSSQCRLCGAEPDLRCHNCTCLYCHTCFSQFHVEDRLKCHVASVYVRN